MDFYRISKSRTPRKGIRPSYLSAPSADAAILAFARTSYFRAVRKLAEDTYQPINQRTGEAVGLPIFVTVETFGR